MLLREDLTPEMQPEFVWNKSILSSSSTTEHNAADLCGSVRAYQFVKS